mmetsp:Transcript_22160/g.30851  ORF Transcript_22160/g.30851 Transcript_22160/m.30851 type:complete len:253 (-) Transcript_22160:106-864(-)
MTEAEAEMKVATEEPVRKRTFLQKLKKKTSFGRRKAAEKKDNRDQEPSIVSSKDIDEELDESTTPQAVTRDGIPIITADNADDFVPSDVTKENADISSSPTKSPRVKKQVVLSKAPPANESAFEGPPRYDWVDIETVAAIKLQSIYRRNQVYQQLEKEGKSTAQMRNRQRRRKARNQFAVSEDTPGMFGFCGVGLLCGDSTVEDETAMKQFEKDKYEAKKQAKNEREERLRKFHLRKKSSTHLVEAVEVMDE